MLYGCYGQSQVKIIRGGVNLERENIDIKDYWPLVVSEILEYKKIAEAENPEINTVWANHERVLANQFVETLTEEGCARWEKILNITPMGTDTLADRRFRILGRINADLPFTITQLKNMLSTLCGDGYTVELQNTQYKLIVKLALSVKRQYDEVSKLLENVVPANLIVAIDILWNQYIKLEPLTHEQLEAYTHLQLREEEFNG